MSGMPPVDEGAAPQPQGIRFADPADEGAPEPELETVLSLDALLERLDELDSEVVAEKQRLLADAAKARLDDAYWANLYCALSDDFADLESEPTQDDDDIGISKILAKRKERNIVYYQVQWREHSQVTWERADDISAARTLLTAFDTYLRTSSKRKGITTTNPHLQTLSRRERRERRRAAEEREGEPDYSVRSSGGAAVRGASLPVAPPPAAAVAVAQPLQRPVYCVEAVRRVIARCDGLYSNSEDVCCKPGLKDISRADQDTLVGVWNDIMLTFTEEKYVQKYGGGEADAALARELRPGGKVPNYFANVGGESIYRRKVLSMAGLRNLVLHGREIFTEMRGNHFSGDLSRYGSTGPAKMRNYTGNAVDLDTVVLRASDRVTLNAINEWNRFKGQPVFSSTSEFGNSLQARQIAVTAAEALLEKFQKEFSLTKQQMKSRRVDPADLDVNNIPVATTNTDRGAYPCWRYTNVGVDSFHANVPSLDDVTGALLRAPFHCIKGWLYAQEDGSLDEFFEDCVVDSCFNMKWKAIEEFCQSKERRGTINQVLEQLQHAHQAAFSALFDKDDSEEAEAAEMLRLLPAGQKGRDASGSFRAITKADITKWVANPQGAL